MTIPDDVIQQATAEFLNVFLEFGGGIDESGKAGMYAALPILRDAIRAELVQEMRDAAHWWIIIKDDEQGQLMDDWLLSYLPESETTP